MNAHVRPARRRLSAVFALLAVAAPGLVASSSLSAATPPALFTRAATGRADAKGTTSKVTVNQRVLRRGVKARVTLDLGKGKRRIANLRPAAAVGKYAHWTGSLEGVPLSGVSVVQTAGSTAAFISSPQGTYQLTAYGKGRHDLLAAKQRKTTDRVRNPGGLAATRTAAKRAKAALARADASPVIEMVIGWTPRAETEAGGTTAIQNLIALSVASTNDAFARSGVTARLKLVATIKGVGTDFGDPDLVLRQVTRAGDGQWDNVSALRDRLGADLVSMFTASSSFIGGVAWYPRSGGAYGFSAVAHGCALTQMCFPHEVGHNLGAGHDRYLNDGGYLPYGHGRSYINTASPGTSWHTVMAYDRECFERVGYCPVIPYFSNPNVRYANQPTGIAYTAANSADNRLAINNTAAMVAGYRSPRTLRPTSYSPTQRATGIAVNTTVTATFPTAMTGITASTFTLRRGTTVVPATVTYNATTRVATLRPTVALRADTGYLATLSTSIRSTAGVALAATGWSFTTGPAPAIVGKLPAPGAVSQPTDVQVIATFSEPVKNVTGSTFYLSSGGSIWTATPRVASTANRWVIDNFLAPDTTYGVHVLGDRLGVTDLAGNAMTPALWSFTTGPAPTIISFAPAVAAGAVNPAANVVVTFSEQVKNVSTSTFYLVTPAGARVPATVGRSGTTNTWVLNPASNLASGTTYRVGVLGASPSSITDLAGNPLPAIKSWVFTTS